MSQTQHGTDYRTSGLKATASEVMDTGREIGGIAYDAAEKAATRSIETAKEYPITTVVAVAGLAFIAGWAMRANKHSRADALLSQLGAYAQRGSSYLPASWR